MYLVVSNIGTVIAVTITIYVIFLFTIYLLLYLNNRNFLLLEKFNYDIKFIVSFNVKLFFQDVILGFITSLIYVIVLQFKYYFYFDYPPIIIFFVFLHLSKTLKKTSVFFNWIGFAIFFYLMNTSDIYTYYIILISSAISLLGIYFLRLILKNKQYIIAFQMLFFLVTIHVIYLAMFKKYYETFSFDFLVNIWISFLSLLFLGSISNYASSFFKNVSYLRKTNSYTHNFFINNNHSLDALRDFINKKNIDLGVYVTFNIFLKRGSQSSTYIEKHCRTLLKMFFEKFDNLFMISPNLAYSFFLKIDNDSDKWKKVQAINQEIQSKIALINKLLSNKDSKFKITAYSAFYGWDFYDYNNLVRSCELGIYNSDFTGNKFYLHFNKEILTSDIELAKLKKQLSVFLKNKNFKIELDLIDNKYYKSELIDSKNMFFNFRVFYNEVPKDLKEIFLRHFAYKALEKFNQTPKKHPILISYPLIFFQKKDYEINKMIKKIQDLKIPIKLVIFDFWIDNDQNNEKIKLLQYNLKKHKIQFLNFNFKNW